MANKDTTANTIVGGIGALIMLSLGCAALTSYVALTYRLCKWVWNLIV